MRTKQLGLVALVAAMTVLPTITIQPASAQNWLQRTFNRVTTPNTNYNSYPYTNYNTYPYTDYTAYPSYSGTTYPYGYTAPSYTYPTTTYSGIVAPSTSTNYNYLTSTGQMSQAQHQAWVDSINARVARGELGLFDGNAILIRGYE